MPWNLPPHARDLCVNGSFTSQAQKRKAGGMVPPANPPEVEMQQTLILLLLFVVIFDVKVKVIVRMR
jgi:hypothetical protein